MELKDYLRLLGRFLVLFKTLISDLLPKLDARSILTVPILRKLKVYCVVFRVLFLHISILIHVDFGIFVKKSLLFTV